MAGYSTLVRPVLASGDIRFAQCERLYSERGSRQVHASTFDRAEPGKASIFTDCGFDVVSVAGNHSMDYGEEALVDTIENLQKRGIKTVGAGRNLEEARKPAVIERKGIKVAFLAYDSVGPEAGAAGPSRAGVAPLRAHTYYETPVNAHGGREAAGFPPRIVTVPFAEDLAHMVEDITRAKREANCVVVSFHWGIHHIPRLIPEYQTIAAETAFKAGADLIFGHHPHVPKAIGAYGGKVCFYSLGNFIMTTTSGFKPGWLARFTKLYGVKPDPEEYPLFPMGRDTHRSLIAKAVISAEGVKRVSFVPVEIDKQMRPRVLTGDEPGFSEAVQFMEWVSEDYPHDFSIEGNEVVIHTQR
jgi:poly-gamma-glutamate synthesis protein (capsule biosynthesis protein)